jgi:antitoxin ParD1/3/4
MGTRTFILPERCERFIDESVAASRYEDANDVVREALLLLEEYEKNDEWKLQRLRAAVKLGFDAIDRGEYREFSVDELHDVMNELSERAAAKARRDS